MDIDTVTGVCSAVNLAMAGVNLWQAYQTHKLVKGFNEHIAKLKAISQSMAKHMEEHFQGEVHREAPSAKVLH